MCVDRKKYYLCGMPAQIRKPLFSRLSALLSLILMWLIFVTTLILFYHKQVTSHQHTINDQIEQRVNSLSLVQADLIDKVFSHMASNLRQLALLNIKAPAEIPDFVTILTTFDPAIWHVYLTNAQGDITFSTREGYQSAIAIRDYFAIHKNTEIVRFYITSPRQSVIQESELYIAMSYPIRTADGVFDGVAVVTMKSKDLASLLGNITTNKNIMAILTDKNGKTIWSSHSEKKLQPRDLYSLCRNNRYQTATSMGIHRIKLTGNNAQCDYQSLDRWGLNLIIAENRTGAEQQMQEHQQSMMQRNIIIAAILTLLLIILGHQAMKVIDSRKLLTLSYLRNRAIINAMPDLLLTIKADGTIIDHEMQDDFPLSIPEAELDGSNFAAIMEPELAGKKSALIAKVLETGETASFEYPMQINNQEYYFLERLTALDKQHVLAFIIDITSRREAERKLEWQAYHDELTGLANRVMFFEFLNKLVQDYHRNKREFTVLFIDLNGFKAINDQYGHHAGDEILRHVGRQLQAALRQTDTPARLGGDEFAVLLPETAPKKVSRVKKAIAEAVKQPFYYQGNQLSVTASIGMAACPDDAITAAELLSAADKRMYALKSGQQR